MKAVLLIAVGIVLLIGWRMIQANNQGNVMPENFPAPESETQPSTNSDDKSKPKAGTELATFGSGCFWCTEACFLPLKGVKQVVSGYCGGHVDNPTYEQICTGKTGHAEVVQVSFDPAVISYAELLEVFWQTHDPTTLNRQGNDVGPQYRSAVFYHDEKQRELAEKYKKKIDEAKVYDSPIVTEIVPLKVFYAAEKYHQNYYALNPNQSYCAYVIQPKVEKLKKVFKDKLK